MWNKRIAILAMISALSGGVALPAIEGVVINATKHPQHLCLVRHGLPGAAGDRRVSPNDQLEDEVVEPESYGEVINNRWLENGAETVQELPPFANNEMVGLVLEPYETLKMPFASNEYLEFKVLPDWVHSAGSFFFRPGGAGVQAKLQGAPGGGPPPHCRAEILPDQSIVFFAGISEDRDDTPPPPAQAASGAAAAT